MIVIKSIPNILSDAGREEKQFEYSSEKTVAEYLMESGFGLIDNKVILSGKKLDDLNVTVTDGDEIIVTPDVKVGVVAAVALFAISTASISFWVKLGLFALVQVLGKWWMDSQRKPANDNATTDNFDSNSPTYSWDGIATTQDVGIPVPVVYGEHRVGGNVINLVLQNHIQYDFYTVAYTPQSVSNSGLVNTFKINDACNMIKFRIYARSHEVRSWDSWPYHCKIFNFIRYKIEYKKQSGGSWTEAYTTPDKQQREVDDAGWWIDTRWVDRRDFWDISFNVEPDAYDVRITELDNHNTNTQYYTDLYINQKAPSKTQADNQELSMLLALCEGEIESIDQIEINNNPINNYSKVEVFRRMGTNSQPIINTFGDLENTYEVGVALTKNSPYVYTMQGADVNAFKVVFSMPNGLYQVDSDGKEQSWEVKYRVEYKLHSGSIYTDLGEYTTSCQQRTRVTKIFRKDDLTAGQYDVRVTRTSDDADLKHAGDLYIQDVIEIKYDDVIYPDTALLGLKVLATEQLSGGTPNITAVVRGRKVRIPRVMYGGADVNWEDYYWDKDTSQYKRFSDNAVCAWDGTTYVERWSANPIWCMRDLMTNSRYGLGEYISDNDIDLPAFVEMSRHCEEKVTDGTGGYEKRYRLDIVIDGTSKALDLLNDICNTFNAFAFYSEGKIKIRIDKPEMPVQLFGMGNIIQDGFGQSWKSLKEIPNAVEIQFLDKEKGYTQETITVTDEAALINSEPLRKRGVRLFVTKTSYAFRNGRFILKYGKYITRTAQIKVGIDAIACQAGDVISVAHDVPQWGISGRVGPGSTATGIVLDKSVTVVTGRTYKLRVRFNDDSIAETTVTSAPGTYDTLTVNPAFTKVPLNYDVYSFGEVNKVKKDWRVVSMQRDNANEVTLGLIEYNANVYDDSDFIVPTPSYSMLRLDIPMIEDLVLTERITKMADGTIADVIDVWFNKPVMNDYYIRAYNKARVYISDDSGVSWKFQGETSGTHFAIANNVNDGQTYRISVTSIDTAGRQTDIALSPHADIKVEGKLLPPNDVVGFSIKQDGDDLVFSWSPNSDVDLYAYEIREGDSWASGTQVVSEVQSNYYRMPVYVFGQLRFMIKAIDTTGNYSKNEASNVITISTCINIESLQNDNLGNWNEGTIELSTMASEPVTNNAGESVTDNTDVVIDQSDLYGFERKTDNGADYYLSLRDFGGHYSTEGRYTSRVVDLLAKVRARISVIFNYEGESCAYAIFISMSDDGITWSALTPFSSGEYECRCFKITFVLMNADANNSGKLTYLQSRSTVRLIEQRGNDVNVNQSLVITFARPFYVKVNIQVIAQGLKYARVTAKSLTGFTVEVHNDSSGTITSGTVDWVAKGY